MIHERKQRTLAGTAAVEGVGYWSGRDIRVEFRPAPPDSGVVFVRGDLEVPRRIPALVAHRLESPRRTTLQTGGVRVEMVEHILAALAGLRIDNCEVWVDAIEMPGLDGSSQGFVDALTAAGSVEQPAWRRQISVTDVTRVGDEQTWIEARPAKSGGLSLRVRIEYAHCPAIGRQTYEKAITPDLFRKDLASARTFILKEEAEWLVKQGLCRRATVKDLLVFDQDGPVDNELRFEDECVRHKTLDLVGDLALAGCDLVASITSNCAGHRLNAELVKAIISQGRIEHLRRTA